MAKIDIIDLEYKRIKVLFNNVESSKSELVDNLIHQAAFMKVELDVLQEQIKKHGAVQVSNKGLQRQTEAAKYYTKLINSYSTIIRTLNSVMGKNTDDDDDAFDEFLRNASS